MNENWFELAIIAFILGSIVLTNWLGRKQGQANPVGTGSLSKKLARLETDVAAVKGDVGSVKGDVGAVSEKVGAIEAQVHDLERRTAKGSDIERLERQIAEMRSGMTEQSVRLVQVGETVAAIRESGEQRGKQLDRLYDHIVQKGMN